MATLEKIRKRSVLLLVVIAMALLAFILGDAINNGRNLFGTGSTVAKIGGEKIDITEYQRRREELNQQYEEARKNNPQQVAGFDVQSLPQMALEQLVSEKLYNAAVAKMGLQVSPSLLRFYMLEFPQPLPSMQKLLQAMQANGLQVASAEQAYDVLFKNPKRYNLTEAQVAPYQQQWLAIEKEYANEISKMTYGRLLAGTFKANALDKQAIYDDMTNTSNVTVAYLPYGQLDAKKYPVSDAELQNAYSAERYRYKIEEPTKETGIISVSVTPSDADRAAAQNLAIRTAAELRQGNQLSKDLKKEGLVPTRRTMRLSDLRDGALKTFVSTASPDTVSIVNNGFQGFDIVKMGRRYADVDSIQIRTVQVAGATLPAKVLARLNAGLSPDSISSVFKADSVGAMPAQWIQLYTAEGKAQLGIQQSLLDSLTNSVGRYMILDQQPEGAVIAAVVKKTAPVQVVEYDEVNYEIHPSQATLEQAREKFEKFLAANNTAAAFMKNAEKAGYYAQTVELTPSSPAVPRAQGMNAFLPDSRQVVRWVIMDADKGEVSHIYESKDAAAPMLYAAALIDEYEDFVPLTNEQVKNEVTERVRRSKAGDEMVKKYSAKAANMASVATAMGVEARPVPALTFAYNPAVPDAKIVGKIAGSPKNGKVVVVKGDNGVFAYTINAKGKEKFAKDDMQLESAWKRIVNLNPDAMLRGAKKLENNQYKFEGGN